MPNLFADLPTTPPAGELFDVLVERAGWKVERIVSWGHATALDEWFDQATDEFVVLLTGSAQLLIEGDAVPREMRPGDWMFLPAHVRHRVERTSANVPTVWLAFHTRSEPRNPRAA